MRAKNIFTLGFFLTIVLVFWVIISFARDGEFFNPVSILSAILGGLLVTFAAGHRARGGGGKRACIFGGDTRVSLRCVVHVGLR